ncbi:hypothetical protein TTHERM_001237399 (macronuclear) [Tetrahymena thermophila SB210]|uniref:Uncharacterized protein n=1 Tax=Tetrahymena thermophila (strain SB210) TaxID=312017 RepID=W7XLQ3_TETTS|nr:hypothetical protein TTHERM_001237399 [Tetrahymena thermophila SB210]EWS76689.1 hypothetical protein TTHERM_001237399 [Tetrahymena thermophila SB210]|eukprot:XP_012650784.1 hypothetical protein TTHERM_001237399 [Tetrahymena thermophila SB210]
MQLISFCYFYMGGFQIIDYLFLTVTLQLNQIEWNLSSKKNYRLHRINTQNLDNKKQSYYLLGENQDIYLFLSQASNLKLHMIIDILISKYYPNPPISAAKGVTVGALNFQTK